MTSGGAGAGVRFTVTGVLPAVITRWDGGVTEGSTVFYTASNGYAGTVFVPRPASADPVKVAAAVEADLRSVLAALAARGTVRG